MKKLLARRFTERYAFTLVELLVVIGIIAILAAVLMNAGNLAIKEAKKAKAQNTATQIQTAVTNYYTEYSVYPTPSGAAASDWKIDDGDNATGLSPAPTGSPWGGLIQCLSGNISPTASTLYSSFPNTRQVAFLTLRASDVSTAAGHLDAPINPLTVSTTNPYFNIAVDGDYDNILGKGSSTSGSWLPNFTTSFTGTTTTMTGLSTAGVAVWANCNTIPTSSSSGWWVHTY
jgi:prepilin-type N-terminal cleavage/methylation domain-containing protein